MSSESDIEMQSALAKTKTKMPRSPSEELLKKNLEPKKISTRDMIKEALSELKSRKGMSLYAIKKHITEKHHVNVDKINYIIKKNIKMGVEDGTIVQTKGIGASGSFRLAPKKKPDPSEKPKKIKKKTEKADKVKKTKKDGDKSEKVEKKVVKKKDGGVKEKTKEAKTSNAKTKEKKSEKSEKTKKSKMAKDMQTPAKKRAAMMKRKSIGSIIKPPKMKPKARA